MSPWKKNYFLCLKNTITDECHTQPVRRFKGTLAISELFLYYWSHTFETSNIYAKQKFETHLLLNFFLDLVHRKRVIQRKRNFQTIVESNINSAILKLEQCLYFLLCSESLTLQMLWNTSCNFGIIFCTCF